MLNVVRQFFPTYHCRFIKQYYYYAIFNGTRRVSRTYLPVSKVIKCAYYIMLVHTQILLHYIICTRVLGSFGWRVCLWPAVTFRLFGARPTRAENIAGSRSTVAHRCLHKRSSYNNYYNGRFRLIFRPEMLYILIRYIVIDSFFYDAQNAYLR